MQPRCLVRVLKSPSSATALGVALTICCTPYSQLRQIPGETAELFSDYVLRMIPPGVRVKLTHNTAEAAPAELEALLGRSVTQDAPGEAGQDLAAPGVHVPDSDAAVKLASGLADGLPAKELAEVSVALDRYLSGTADSGSLGAALGTVLADKPYMLDALRAFVADGEAFQKGAHAAAQAMATPEASEGADAGAAAVTSAGPDKVITDAADQLEPAKAQSQPMDDITPSEMEAENLDTPSEPKP